MAEVMKVSDNTIDISLEKEIYRAAINLLSAFFMLTKTARMYEINNDSYLKQADRFFEHLNNHMVGRGNCSIKIADDRVFLDDHFVKIELDDRVGADAVAERWNELGIGGVVIGDTINREQFDTFINFLWSFKVSGEYPYQEFVAKLVDTGIDAISVLPKQMLTSRHRISSSDRRVMRQQARNTFFKAISTVKEVISSAEKQEKISVTRTKRVVHSIIDQISEDEAALIELASIKSYDEYTYAHCTNVCIYSLTLGFRFGLNRRELSELGFAALFHDIGKIKLPNDLINKPDRYDEFDWAQMHKHPVFGAMTMARTLKLDTHMARAMAVAYEHHMNPDFTGYPTLPEPRAINLYSRIVSITDSFDALASGRLYIKDPIPPDEVLRKMMYQMKVKFDPFLLKMFIGIIGIYPVGSMVLLSDNTFGIITKSNENEISRPEIRVIADRDGERDQSTLLDLSLDGSKNINIVRIIDAARYGIDQTKYILAD